MAAKRQRARTAARVAAIAIVAVALAQCAHTPSAESSRPAAIPLALTTIVVANPPDKPRAYLHDKNGRTFEGVEGDIIDGRYKLLRVGTDSVVITYLDGTGQRVIYRGG